MIDRYLTTEELKNCASQLRCSQKIYLSGVIYTARDAAHSKICKLIEENKELPFDISGAVIYYAGPTPSKEDGSIGSFGPTTSSRMDRFSPMLLDRGLLAMIGKGNRNAEVTDAIVRNKAVYFCAGGGLGALISRSIERAEEIAFPELGCESVKKLYVKDMPLITAVDSFGDSIFNLR
ncbi:MAG: fumarate hydratase C-terminal domain-containing protein [Clostridia bacterium]|nr:fumarate hydratase C-terminal domain-containing protein [Clostridia bacterium]